MSTTTVPTDPQPTTPPATGDATGTNGGGQGNTPPERTFTQAELDAIVTDRLARATAAESRKRETAEKAAADAALADQQKFKELAEQRGERIAELEAQAQQIETLTSERDAAHAVIAGLVEDELKLAPAYVADAISERTPVAKLDYLRKHRESWTRTNGNPAGVPPTPRANGTPPNREELIDAEIAAQRSKGRR